MLVPLEYQCLTTFQENVSPKGPQMANWERGGGSTVTSSDPRHFRDIWVLSGKWLIKCTSSQSSMSHSSFVRRIHGLVGKNWKMRISVHCQSICTLNTCAFNSWRCLPYIVSTLPGLCPRFCRVHSQYNRMMFYFFLHSWIFVWNYFHSGVVGVEEGTLAFCTCACALSPINWKKDQRRPFIKRLCIYIYIVGCKTPDSRIPVASMIPFRFSDAREFA